MNNLVIFDPLVPWVAIAALGIALGGVLAFAGFRGLRGAGLRGLGVAILLFALANPSLHEEDRTALSDIVVVVVDNTASQQISNRAAQTEAALSQISAKIAARPNTELHVQRLTDAPGDRGTELMRAVNQTLADIPNARVAGIVLITDGQIHDLEKAPDLPAPLHVLLTGEPEDWDRRLVISNAPAFGIIDEQVTITLRIEDQGAVPADLGGLATVQVSVDGAVPFAVQLPIGRDIAVPLVLRHGGRNVVQFTLPEAPGELTHRNNAAVVQINGVRDRLRVLLVSGEPHAGERTWRNLLKSDSAVDLVHFTILRPPDKQDGVPVSELSLIAFPTRELFLEKIDDFDLIIFDRYSRRGILPDVYFASIRDYIRAGGAVLIAAGPDFAGVNSIYRSPLARVIPGTPTAQILQGGFQPQISDLGQRHPVTAGLAPVEGPDWGRWMRMIEVRPKDGAHTVMTGPGDAPLLILNRVDEGRVALLASDHAWLWDRGFEGGGPQLELLRRLAHWMMGEPELEENALVADAEGQTMTLTRRALSDEAHEVSVVGPDGAVVLLQLDSVGPGRAQTTFEAPEPGLYRLQEGDLETVIGIGPAAPREFINTMASADSLGALVAEARGGILPIHAGVPDIRLVRQNRVASGRGWIGLTPRHAALTSDLQVSPLVAAWIFLPLAVLLSLAAWLRESRHKLAKSLTRKT